MYTINIKSKHIDLKIVFNHRRTLHAILLYLLMLLMCGLMNLKKRYACAI